MSGFEPWTFQCAPSTQTSVSPEFHEFHHILCILPGGLLPELQPGPGLRQSDQRLQLPGGDRCAIQTLVLTTQLQIEVLQTTKHNGVKVSDRVTYVMAVVLLLSEHWYIKMWRINTLGLLYTHGHSWHYIKLVLIVKNHTLKSGNNKVISSIKLIQSAIYQFLKFSWIHFIQISVKMWYWLQM